MRKMTNILAYIWRGVATLMLIATLAIVATGISPIYHFPELQPFSGAYIFNPYRNIDTTHCWKRANFHTHTRVKGPMNECELWPEGVIEAYDRFDYDIVTFSNHNEITTHPNPELQVDLYEHGYNILKFHKLVFGPKSGVWHFDHLLPILTSQRQWQIDMLTKECDFIQLNHPLRTPMTTTAMLRQLGGYTIMELDSGRSTENEYWDSALSAGHYSFGLAGDDLHYPDRSSKIAMRCNFLCTPSATYADLRHTLQDGCYYSMRLPDYGNGDWQVKIERNKSLPAITDIDVDEGRIFAEFSQRAKCIIVYGQNHATLHKELNSSRIEYCLGIDEPYARIVAHFDQGEVIYTNPFARYDSTTADSPFREPTHSVDWLLTILFNTTLAILAALIIVTIVKIWRPKR